MNRLMVSGAVISLLLGWFIADHFFLDNEAKLPTKWDMASTRGVVTKVESCGSPTNSSHDWKCGISVKLDNGGSVFGTHAGHPVTGQTVYRACQVEQQGGRCFTDYTDRPRNGFIYK